jgi:putative flippase GtrA
LGRVSDATFVQRIAQRRGVRQFVKFGIVGASGLIVNLIVFSVLQHYTPVEMQRGRYPINFSVAFLSGGLSNYFLNRVWTFRASGHAVVQGMKFIAVSGVALAVGLIVSHYATPYLGPGHKTWFLATLSGIVVNFFVNKYWTFREG